MKIKVGDTVVVIAGKDKNKTGEVLKTYISQKRVLVEGINIVTKHIKKSQQGEQGKIIKVEKSIDVSNIMLVCPFSQKRTRIGYKGEGKDKRRISKKSNKAIEESIKSISKKK